MEDNNQLNIDDNSSMEANYGSSSSSSTSPATKQLMGNIVRELRHLSVSVNQLNTSINDNINQLNTSINGNFNQLKEGIDKLNNRVIQVEKLIISSTVSLLSCCKRSESLSFR